MKFAQLAIGDYYVIKADKGHTIYRKLNYNVARCPDGTVFEGAQGSHGSAELERASILDVLAFETKQAEDGR